MLSRNQLQNGSERESQSLKQRKSTGPDAGRRGFAGRDPG
jgi:hypothetical protein